MIEYPRNVRNASWKYNLVTTLANPNVCQSNMTIIFSLCSHYTCGDHTYGEHSGYFFFLRTACVRRRAHSNRDELTFIRWTPSNHSPLDLLTWTRWIRSMDFVVVFFCLLNNKSQNRQVDFVYRNAYTENRTKNTLKPNKIAICEWISENCYVRRRRRVSFSRMKSMAEQMPNTPRCSLVYTSTTYKYIWNPIINSLFSI